MNLQRVSLEFFIAAMRTDSGYIREKRKKSIRGTLGTHRIDRRLRDQPWRQGRKRETPGRVSIRNGHPDSLVRSLLCNARDARLSQILTLLAQD